MKLFKKLFKRGYEMTLNRVHDNIIIREGNDSLNLSVNGDGMRIVAGLNKARERLNNLTDDTPDDEVKEAAKYFAAVIFGAEQAEKLLKFYADDPGCVITVCGEYFKNRLAGKIAAVQKKMKT